MVSYPQYNLQLRGWDYQSVWGWDPVEKSFYAQLTSNADDREADAVGPEIWLSPPWGPRSANPRELAGFIAQATGNGLDAAREAMNRSLPDSDDPLYQRPQLPAPARPNPAKPAAPPRQLPPSPPTRQPAAPSLRPEPIPASTRTTHGGLSPYDEDLEDDHLEPWGGWQDFLERQLRRYPHRRYSFCWQAWYGIVYVLRGR